MNPPPMSPRPDIAADGNKRAVLPGLAIKLCRSCSGCFAGFVLAAVGRLQLRKR